MSTSDEPLHENVLQATGARARLARVYAEALIALAAKTNEADAIGEELNTLAFGVFANNPGVENFFSSPAVSNKYKQAILGSSFGGTSPLLQKFLGLLNQNRRLFLLRDIAGAYLKIRDTQAGRVRVTVRSATPLNEAQQDNLKKTLAEKLNKQPILALKVEPDLLGGLLVQVGDRIYDTTVKARLDNLRNHLLTSGNYGA
jgi:F-type H+-transporting ATPase subunit delta